MARKSGIIVFLLGVILVVFFLGSRSSRHSSQKGTASSDNEQKTKTQEKLSKSDQAPEVDFESAHQQTVLREADIYLQNYASPGIQPIQDLAFLKTIFHLYQSRLKGRTLLPASDNKSLVQTLRGKNALNLKFISDDFPYLNEEGELVDRWKTPLFFHFKNIENPEIRSAGEDRELWSEDDLILE